jgi:hypothetical protein
MISSSDEGRKEVNGWCKGRGGGAVGVNRVNQLSLKSILARVKTSFMDLKMQTLKTAKEKEKYKYVFLI